jgi:putative FmdB family regulatory protein
MPIYEYQCQSCGHEFEALQKISDPLLTDCPECRQVTLKKKVSAAAFRLKGGGWYETDFKKTGQKNVAGEKSGDDKSKAADGGDKSGADKKSADTKSGGEGSSKSSTESKAPASSPNKTSSDK